MKILHVVPNPFYIERGSPVRIRQEISLALQRGHICSVAAYHLGRDLPEVPVCRIPRIPWYNRLEPGATIHRLYLDLLLAAVTLKHGLAFRPDIIHAHLHEGVFAALPLARLLRIPLILDAEGSLCAEMEQYKFPGAKLFRPMEQCLNKSANGVVASTSMLAYYIQQRFGVASERCYTLHDCIDTAHFCPRQPERALLNQLGIPQNAPIVVYLGSFEMLQGMEVLLNISKDCYNRNRSIHFLIMGFPNGKEWEKRFRESGIATAHFTGKVARERAPAYLSVGTVAVAPKQSGTFQANGKLIDYMAMGLPIVAFDTEANREILGMYEHLIPEGNSQLFADKVCHFIDNPNIAQTVGKELRERALARFAAEVQGEVLEGIYKSMLSGVKNLR